MDTRTRLVHAAMQLFWEKGYNSTSIADVLQSAKVNAGSLYHYFPGKQDLLLAVLDAYHGGIHEVLLEPAWQGVTDPLAKVFALLARYRAALLQTECSYGCPIGSLALELHEPDLPVRQGLARNFEAWISAIEVCLTGAGARLPAELDRRHLAEFVLTTMEGAVMQARTFREIGYYDRAVAQLERYFQSLERESNPSRRAATRARSAHGKRRKT